jgi:uroporphyrinogen-III synthase
MRVLITRPLGDAQETAAKLQTLGHETIVAPLMDIRFRDGGEISLDGVQAILATSANGARAIARRTARRDVPLFAVGTQTAQAASDAGFAAVLSADGDGAALAKAAAQWARPADGALLHAAGAQTRGDLAAALEAHGLTVRTEILYDAAPVTALPQAVTTALQTQTLDAVLLFSPRGARTFRELATAAGLAGACRAVVAICISQATAAALDGLVFRGIRVAAHPRQDTLLTLLT